MMAKMRVHELAKELGLSSKDAISKLAALGIEVKSHASSIETADAERLRGWLDRGGGPAAATDEAEKAAKGATPAKPQPKADSQPDPEPEPEPEPVPVAETPSSPALHIHRGATV